NQRYIQVAHFQLAGEDRFRVLGHVNDFPAGTGEPLALRAGAEPGSLNDHDRTVLVGPNAKGLRFLDAERAELRTIRIGGADVDRARAFIKGIGSAGGSIHELVAEDKITRSDVHLQ